MICPACEGDMFLPQYDEEGDINHFSECWLCNGVGKIKYKDLPPRVKSLVSFRIKEIEDIEEKESKNGDE